jgi:hypothetical protein
MCKNLSDGKFNRVNSEDKFRFLPAGRTVEAIPRRIYNSRVFVRFVLVSSDRAQSPRHRFLSV